MRNRVNSDLVFRFSSSYHGNKVTIKKEILWYVLAFLCVNISRYQIDAFLKTASIGLTALFLVAFFHLIIVQVIVMVNMDVVKGIFFALQIAQTLLIWYLLFRARRAFSSITRNLNLYRSQYNVANGTWAYFTSTVIVLGAMLSPLIAVIIRYRIPNHQGYVDTYVSFICFGYESEDETLKWLVVIYYLFMSYMIYIIPFLFAMSLSIMFWRWASVLKSNERLMNRNLKERNSDDSVQNLKDCFSIIQVLQKMNDNVHVISFFVIVYALYCIFLSLLDVVTTDMSVMSADIDLIIDVIFGFTCGILVIVTYIACCSRIPENLSDIKRTARKFIVEYGSSHSESDEVLFYLGEIEKEEILYMTAGNMFTIDRGLILEAIGAALTYDLLIINLVQSKG